MRKGIRIAIGCAVVAAVGAGGLTLMSSSEEEAEPIRVGAVEVVTGLDPAGVYDSGSWSLFSNVYQSLMTFRPGSLQPVPDAASSCGFEGNGLTTYVCTLRDDVSFSDGREMTAQDVKFSFDRIRAIKDDQGPHTLLSTLKKVRTEGDRKVVFELSTPDATFPYKIATGAGSIVDSKTYPADRLRTDDKVSGSGPYVLAAYKKGESAELRPNDKYRGAAGTGGPVNLRYFTSAAAVSSAWKKKEVDVVSGGMPPKELADINPADPDTKVVESAAANARTLVLDQMAKDSPVKEKAVRRALAAVLDRDAISRDVYARTVDPLYSLIPQGVNGHKTPFHDSYPKPDPDRAREMLTEAGLTEPVKLTIGHAKGTMNEAEAKLIQRQLNATGLFEVKLRGSDFAVFQENISAHAFDAFLISWVADYPDPDTFTTPLVGPDPVWRNGYKSKQIQSLIERTQEEPKRERTAEDFRTVQQIVADDVPIIPLWQQKDYVLSSNEVSGTEYLSDGTNLWRLWRLNRI
ncbi:peptide-binding protein [Streptomyces pactum]|uniref:Peptide-binding protein n=1 Tax=Streptomyces pactum TaxID=68249 RepID=A0ABS0NMT3_9ACTN|nr:ABC transporter substrate-binding protein [Streptomyces pactum]MBH5336520.1 peptide-binding protein [Streptomyces pactum]